MAKLTEKQCERKIKSEYNKYIKKNEVNEDFVEFYGDVTSEAFYSWRMYIPELNKSVCVSCEKSTGKSSIEEWNGHKWSC